MHVIIVILSTKTFKSVQRSVNHLGNLCVYVEAHTVLSLMNERRLLAEGKSRAIHEFCDASVSAKISLVVA